jgi:beta-glucanase (GH16 family)
MQKLLLTLICAALPAGAADWKLVWSDEFDKPGPPDSSRWTFETGFVRNQEAQFYTAGRAENARVEDGKLVLEARRETWPNPAFKAGSSRWNEAREKADYTSASLTTDGKASWSHGKVAVRAKLPGGRGTWPAIWMLGVNRRQAGWPKCGEIDIMEQVGYDPLTVHANIHTEAYNHARKTNKGNKIQVAAPDREFHEYSVEWDTSEMRFAVDGKVYFTYANEKTGVAAWPYNQPFYLILNVAVGGSWGGREGIDETAFPRRMEVDWVRVWQKTGQAEARK